MSYQILCNGTKQKSLKARSGLALTPSRFTPLHKIRYDIELLTEAPDHIAKMIESLHEYIGANQMMAYLVMMTARLVELHRVLKPTGSLYLHCDPTASHYLKVILDTIFSPRNFRNEIIWKRQTAHSDAKYKFADVADIILVFRPITFRFSDR